MKNNFYEMMEEYRTQSEVKALTGSFPELSSLDEKLLKKCVEIHKIAKVLTLDPQRLLEDFMSDEMNFSNVILFSEKKKIVGKQFISQAEACAKCRKLHGKTVSIEKYKDEKYMKSLGFEKQKDGEYHPHPSCKCIWKDKFEELGTSKQDMAKKVSNVAESIKTAAETAAGPSVAPVLDAVKVAAEIATNFNHWVWMSKALARELSQVDSEFDLIEAELQINDYNTAKDAKGLARYYVYMKRRFQNIKKGRK